MKYLLAGAPGAPGVTVLGEEGTQVAVLEKAKCTKTKKKSFFLDSTSTNGQYELSAIILNENVPPYPVPGFGEINFTLECTYPKKKKGK